MLSFILSLFISTASAASCPSAVYGIPENNPTLQTVDICHTGYFTKYSYTKKDPALTIWSISKTTATGCLSRQGNFSHDPELENTPFVDANPSDYDKTGYDKGHIADAKDFEYDVKTERESFYMTNMTPQEPGLNRNGWKWFEAFSRVLAVEYNNVVIYSGPVFTNNDSILTDDVVIPEYFYKIVYIPSLNKAISILVPNKDISGSDILNYLVSVDEIQNKIGFNILLPSQYDKSTIETKQSLKSDINFKLLSAQTNQVCGIKN